MPAYLCVSGVPGGSVADGIVALAGRVLPRGLPLDLAERLGRAHDPWGVVALEGEQVVGFKLGYSDRPGRFYSWLGGVAPEHQRRGIATELMRRQHARCREVGYARVRTHTVNERKPMLILNIQSGFDIIGVTASAGKALRIVLERRL